MIRSLLLAASLAVMFSGCCIDRMSGRVCGPGGCGTGRGGCGPTCSDCPYGCDNGSFLRNMLGGCSGCGEIYWNEWANDPPDCCDPCDNCGHNTGPRCCMPRNTWRNMWGQRCGGDCSGVASYGPCGGCRRGCSSCSSGCSSCGGECSSCRGGSGWGGAVWGCSTCGLSGRYSSCGSGGCSSCGGSGCSSCGGGGCSSCGGAMVPEGMPIPSPSPATPKMDNPFQDDPEQAAPAVPKNSRQPTPARRITTTAPQGQLMTSNQPMLRPWTPVRSASAPMYRAAPQMR